jgi:hypothetical protein
VIPLKAAQRLPERALKCGYQCVRQPVCDESGVGFGARLAENSTPLWSHQSILRSDETWLPEWSGNLGGVQRWRSSVAWGVLGQASLPAMTDDVMQAAMTTWAAKDIPARLLAGQVAKLLNCSTDDVAILVSAGKLRALGKPRPNAVKFFSAIELISLLADCDWLEDATRTIIQFWKRKNARRQGLTTEEHPQQIQLPPRASS